MRAPVRRPRALGAARFARTACALGIALLAWPLAGCESAIEPRSPVDEWDPFEAASVPPPNAALPGASEPPESPGTTRHTFIAEEAMFQPAPPRERPRSISLGYVGDGPLTPSAPTPPRWPWVPERFHNDRWGRGYLSPRYARPYRW